MSVSQIFCIWPEFLSGNQVFSPGFHLARANNHKKRKK